MGLRQNTTITHTHTHTPKRPAAVHSAIKKSCSHWDVDDHNLPSIMLDRSTVMVSSYVYRPAKGNGSARLTSSIVRNRSLASSMAKYLRKNGLELGDSM